MTQQKAETKHTPGPWTVNAPDADYEYSSSIDGRDGSIATVWGTDECEDQQANARLIAAAPDLLAALDYLLEQTVDRAQSDGVELTELENEAVVRALAAIAKATP